MEDRYEIKGKIAQGGLGSVYKAHDIRMSRDVAIKRILTNPDDSSVTDEATRQLIKEASALASLQHPNIVTIYDVGKDADGPFVVMELLSGQTIEEVVSQGSFIWEDFRQLAMQSLEALIAAQELHIVHRDIKPGNIMLTWLPSGKFQVKVVDFGLAKLSAKPSLQTIDQSDGVFGSIYFMGPEQFERIPIDQRVDLYALGCVFYYALTGTYPFDGDSAVEVMASHLQHHVVPIEQVRAGIPLWACNWVMWLINRQPSDRPNSAREALQVFMQNDSAWVSPELSTGVPPSTAPAESLRRPKLLIPGSVPEHIEEPKPQGAAKTATASKPLTPHGTKSSNHNSSVTTSTHAATSQSTPQVNTPQPEPISPAPPIPPEPVAPKTPAAPQTKAPVLLKSGVPVTPRARPTAQTSTSLATNTPAASSSHLSSRTPTGSAHSSSLGQSKAGLNRPGHGGTQTSHANAQSASEHETSSVPHYQPPQKKPIPNSIKAVLTVILLIVVVILAFYLVGRQKEGDEIKLFNEMVSLAAKEGTTEVPVNKEMLHILLRNAASPTGQEDRSAIYTALYLAKATDNTDIDMEIAKFSTSENMHRDIRVVLLKDVLGKRKNPSVVHTLLDYSKSSTDPITALAAIQGCRQMASEAHFDLFLDILKNTSSESIRTAAEENLISIISKSSSTASFRSTLVTTYKGTPVDSVKHAILRLLARIGGDQALEFVKECLNSPDRKSKMIALGALGNWADSEGFDLIMETIRTETDSSNRAMALDAAIKFATNTKSKSQDAWNKIVELADTEQYLIKVINGLAAKQSNEPWVLEILNKIENNNKKNAAGTRAKNALEYLKKIE